jgi:hypothetical protein
VRGDTKGCEPKRVPTATKSATLPDSELSDPELALVVDAWDRLPEPIRAGILAMVKVSSSAAKIHETRCDDTLMDVLHDDAAELYRVANADRPDALRKAMERYVERLEKYSYFAAKPNRPPTRNLERNSGRSFGLDHFVRVIFSLEDIGDVRGELIAWELKEAINPELRIRIKKIERVSKKLRARHLN